MTRLVVLVSITLLLESIGLPQPVTGPLVNMMLFLTTLVLGPWAGVALGCITPLAAALRGQLPPALLPMVPFIIAGNALLVIFFAVCFSLFSKLWRIKDRSFFLPAQAAGIMAGSLVKFLWLYSAARFVLPLLFGVRLSKTVLVMMAAPQFVTAVIGGFAAVAVYTLLRKYAIVEINEHAATGRLV